ncbi:hypothetical protein LRO89_07820 [Priestia megaterium]|uniref:hypothetical protein n=1 Tax=Priestia megaterium TaxID=1404 RepID=UPI0039C1EB4C
MGSHNTNNGEHSTSNAFKLLPDSFINDLDNDPKRKISMAIKDAMKSQDLSIRKLADKMESTSHPQIVRVTSRANYNIDTLIKILDTLNLEIEVKPKS